MFALDVSRHSGGIRRPGAEENHLARAVAARGSGGLARNGDPLATRAMRVG